MKILIVSLHPTHPSIEGNRKFILRQTELFERLGHSLHLLLVSLNNEEWADENTPSYYQIKEIWQGRLSIYRCSWFYLKKRGLIEHFRNVFNGGCICCDDYYPNDLGSFVNNLNKEHNFDCCIINYYILSKLFSQISIPLQGLVTHDHFSYKNILTGEKKVWIGTMPNQEGRALQRCKNIFALNTEEASFFKCLSPRSNIYNVFSIYNVIQTPITNNHSILFLSGNNKYNQNGLLWFIDSVFPKILKRFPDSKLVIAGGICKYLDCSYMHKNIQLLGYVNDELELYKLGDVAINPTYQGTGLKIKTFEAISYGKIVMAHPHSAIGIYKPEEAPVFTSDDPLRWVDFLVKIWDNPRRIEELKMKDEEYIEEMNNFVISEYQRFFNS